MFPPSPTTERTDTLGTIVLEQPLYMRNSITYLLIFDIIEFFKFFKHHSPYCFKLILICDKVPLKSTKCMTDNRLNKGLSKSQQKYVT